jgi:ribonuclease HII
MTPTLDHERHLRSLGYAHVAGIDEAGRGCLAGPVVAAAVVLRPDTLETPDDLAGIDDSKRLTPAQRAELLPRVRHNAAAIGIGMVPAFLIDSLGIIRATRLAMELAVLYLARLPDALLIDALTLPALPVPQTALIHGDSLSYSIAAASIVAKTARDNWMVGLDRVYHAYGFAAHKGYGTTQHMRALDRWGSCPEHRATFRPLWNKEIV